MFRNDGYWDPISLDDDDRVETGKNETILDKLSPKASGDNSEVDTSSEYVDDDTSSGGRNDVSSDRWHKVGTVFYKHVQDVVVDSDHYKNMYCTFKVMAIADKERRTYLVEEADRSLTQMHHKEILQHLEAYDEFCTVSSRTMLKFSNDIAYYCTEENDTPWIIAWFLSTKDGFVVCDELEMAICKSILNNDFKKFHLGKLRKNTKFKAGTQVQFDPSLFDDNLWLSANVTLHRYSDVSSDRWHKVGTVFYKHVQDLVLDGDHYKNMYWTFNVMAIADRERRTYLVEQADLSLTQMYHDEILQHLEGYDKFYSLPSGAVLQFSNDIAYYHTEENDTPKIIASILSKNQGFVVCDELSMTICEAILNNDFNKHRFGKLRENTKFKAGTQVQFDPSLFDDNLWPKHRYASYSYL